MKVLISILFFIMANLSFAEDNMRYYDVEIIIIENLSDESKKSENWPLQVNLTPPEKTVQLDNGKPVLSEWLPEGVDLKSSYKLLNKSQHQLNDEVEKISKSKTQRVIFHAAWRQPGLDKNTALPIYFKREVAAPAVPEYENALTQNEETFSPDINKTETLAFDLEGIIRVTLARYLHLEAELVYQKQIPPITYNDNPFSVFDNENEGNKIEKQGVIHFKQKRRRIRSNELHYLDHPVLGMLVRITPYIEGENVVNNVIIKK